REESAAPWRPPEPSCSHDVLKSPLRQRYGAFAPKTALLNEHWFLTLADAAEKLEAWRRYYNEERPHGAIGNKVPIMLTKSGGVTSPSP
ncbi:integrase core domain-containing protein, partial [Paracoccus yeei]|uniref:integrase core domain-containing protein n=2 Tax=Paracoccus yeei TaxID=147645 RepID=UPI00200B45B8